MGMFATIKGQDKCPKCGMHADWQSKGLWLNYKGRDIWIGDEHEIELDENMHGGIVAYGLPKEVKNKVGESIGCGHKTYYKICKGQLIESTKEDYRNYNDRRN